MKTKAQDKVEKMTVKGRETIAQEQKKWTAKIERLMWSEQTRFCSCFTLRSPEQSRLLSNCGTY